MGGGAGGAAGRRGGPRRGGGSGSLAPSVDAGRRVARTPLPSRLPSPAGRGSAPGWGGGGPDACDWPRPHLGRRAPPPPSCWEQLLLPGRPGSGSGAGAGWGSRGGGAGSGGGDWGWLQAALASARTRPRAWGALSVTRAGTRGAGTCARRGSCVALQKDDASSWPARPRGPGWRPGGPGGFAETRVQSPAGLAPLITRVGDSGVWTRRKFPLPRTPAFRDPKKPVPREK